MPSDTLADQILKRWKECLAEANDAVADAKREERDRILPKSRMPPPRPRSPRAGARGMLSRPRSAAALVVPPPSTGFSPPSHAVRRALEVDLLQARSLAVWRAAELQATKTRMDRERTLASSGFVHEQAQHHKALSDAATKIAQLEADNASLKSELEKVQAELRAERSRRR